MHGWELYKLGINHYASGTIRNGKKIYGYFYKLCEELTEERLNGLKQTGFSFELGTSSPQYAPELKSRVLIILSMAELKRQKRGL